MNIKTPSSVGLLFALAAYSSLVYSAPIQTFTYEADKIYPVYTGIGIATQIEIDPNEEVKDYGTGFSNGWDLVRRDHVFYLKPKAPDADTNMYIRTEKRVYLLELKVISKEWKNLEEVKTDGVNYQVRFNYSPNDAASVKPPLMPKSKLQLQEVPATAEAEAQKSTISGFTNYHMNYQYAAEKDAAWLVPTKVYDDGNFMYIHLPANASAPAIYGAKVGETESLLNTTTEGNVVIIHGIYPNLILRHGSSVVGLRRL